MSLFWIDAFIIYVIDESSFRQHMPPYPYAPHVRPQRACATAATIDLPLRLLLADEIFDYFIDAHRLTEILFTRYGGCRHAKCLATYLYYSLLYYILPYKIYSIIALGYSHITIWPKRGFIIIIYSLLAAPAAIYMSFIILFTWIGQASLWYIIIIIRRAILHTFKSFINISIFMLEDK